MISHVLNGDALTDRFIATGLPGEIIVCRECLVDGPLEGDGSAAFFNKRADYLDGLGEDDRYYRESVATEFEKIIQLPTGSEINLWFGYDLFCRVNMLLILSLLNKKGDIAVFVVHPSHLAPADRWKDFGGASPSDLKTCFDGRISLSKSNITFGSQCWEAYKNNDLAILKKLSATAPSSFPYFQEVVEAHLDRFPGDNQPGRPEKVIAEIIQQTGKSDFETVFREFWKREGIYGFGDTQVKQSYDKVIAAR